MTMPPSILTDLSSGTSGYSSFDRSPFSTALGSIDEVSAVAALPDGAASAVAGCAV